MKLSETTVMLLAVANISCTVGFTVKRDDERLSPRARSALERKSKYDYAPDLMRPIQQILKKEFEGINVEEEFPTLAPSESHAPGSALSQSPSIIPSEATLSTGLDMFPLSQSPSIIPSEATLSTGLEMFPSLSPSESTGPSGDPSFIPSGMPSGITIALSASLPDPVPAKPAAGGLVFPPWASSASSDEDKDISSIEAGDLSPTLAPSESPEPVSASSYGPSDVPSLVPSLVSGNMTGAESSSSLIEDFEGALPTTSTELQSASAETASSAEEQEKGLEFDEAEVGAAPTLAPSASPEPILLSSQGPSEMPSVLSPLLFSEVPSLMPSNLTSVEDDIVGATDKFPSLAPSSSLFPSGAPSNVPSGAPSSLPGDDPLVFVAPSLTPSASPVPSIIPSGMPSNETQANIDDFVSIENPIEEGGRGATITCDLDASIQCETTNGESCSFAEVPAADMMCQESPLQLIWKYTGGNCSSSSAQSAFTCEDVMTGGTASASSVYIMLHGEDPEEIYYEGFANITATGHLDSIIEVNLPFPTPMENLFIHVKSNDPSGELLQMIVIPNTCHPQDGLVIGKTYGALQFVGYQTESKSVQGFAHLEWTFVARSEVGLDLTVKTATIVLGNKIQSFASGMTLSPLDEATFTSYETISLHEPDVFSGAVTVVATGSDGTECVAAATSYVYV